MTHLHPPTTSSALRVTLPILLAALALVGCGTHEEDFGHGDETSTVAQLDCLYHDLCDAGDGPAPDTSVDGSVDPDWSDTSMGDGGGWPDTMGGGWPDTMGGGVDPDPSDTSMGTDGGYDTDGGYGTDGGYDTDGGDAPCDCAPHEVACDGQCVDPLNDPLRCGAAGLCVDPDPASGDYRGTDCAQILSGAWGASAACVEGRCELICAPGRFDCDGDPFNGCEATEACDCG